VPVREWFRSRMTGLWTCRYAQLIPLLYERLIDYLLFYVPLKNISLI
jgi:hypothetical protein